MTSTEVRPSSLYFLLLWNQEEPELLGKSLFTRQFLRNQQGWIHAVIYMKAWAEVMGTASLVFLPESPPSPGSNTGNSQGAGGRIRHRSPPQPGLVLSLASSPFLSDGCYVPQFPHL